VVDHPAKWDDVFKQPKHRWRQPHERLCVFAKALRKRGFRRVLDIGCGCGRHLVYLAERGFEVYGLDISSVALREAHRNLQHRGLAAELMQGDMDRLPYQTEYMDAALCMYVIYHCRLSKISEVLSEIGRVLRPGGLALIVFLSREHWGYGVGERIEAGTFRLETEPHPGVPHHFSDRSEVEMLMDGFSVLSLELQNQRDGKGRLHSHWLVMAQKPGDD